MITVRGFVQQQPYHVVVDDAGHVVTPEGLPGDEDVAAILALSTFTAWPPTPTSGDLPFDLTDPVSVAAALIGQTTVTSLDLVLAPALPEGSVG